MLDCTGSEDRVFQGGVRARLLRTPGAKDGLVADTPIDERRFTDEEVREILRRAVRTVPSHAVTRSEGLSLAELKAIGQEVGIDPARLEDAARDLVSGRSDRSSLLLGAPTVLALERRVEGTFDPKDTPEILSAIRRIMGRQGVASEIHGSLEWRAEGDTGARLITLSTRDGVMTISASANLNSAAAVTFLPGGILGVIVSVAGLSELLREGSVVGLVLFLGVIPILYPILRSILRRVSDSEARKLQRVVDELARLTEKTGPG